MGSERGKKVEPERESSREAGWGTSGWAQRRRRGTHARLGLLVRCCRVQLWARRAQSLEIKYGEAVSHFLSFLSVSDPTQTDAPGLRPPSCRPSTALSPRDSSPSTCSSVVRRKESVPDRERGRSVRRCPAELAVNALTLVEGELGRAATGGAGRPGRIGIGRSWAISRSERR